MDRNVHPSPQLEPNSRIAVIGGGPSGSIFALHALAIASSRNLPLHVTIFERKDLTAVGPRGCNMCAGILSHRVIQGLKELEIEVPDQVILGRVRNYRLHWHNRAISIEPPDPARQVISVYRAGGPRKSPFQPTAGFDEFLLRQAISRGARVIPERVQDVILGEPPQIRTTNRREPFDLVVLACGVNATPPAFKNHNYLHPQIETMAQDALLLDSERSRELMAGTVHIYFDQPESLIFGALVPKGNFATISLLGQRLERDSLQQLLDVPAVKDVVGAEPAQMCGCRPHVAIGTARGTFSNRFVAVGDSCVTRLYKDGIGSAMVTARAAAQTALQFGIGYDQFARHYEPVCRAIARDNRYGKLIFKLIRCSKSNKPFMRALGSALQEESAMPRGDRIMSQTLWALLTGDADYSAILAMMTSPGNAFRVVLAMSRRLMHNRVQAKNCETR